MSEPKVAREVAEKEVESWCEVLGCAPDLSVIDDAVLGTMAGRVLFDVEKEEFSYTLRKPIKLENGDCVTVVKISEPNARQLSNANKTKNEIEQALLLLSAVSGIASGVLDRMKQRDIVMAGELSGFFT